MFEASERKAVKQALSLRLNPVTVVSLMKKCYLHCFSALYVFSFLILDETHPTFNSTEDEDSSLVLSDKAIPSFPSCCHLSL